MGEMPKRALALILEWWHLHRNELAENWRRSELREPLEADRSIGVAMHYTVVEARHVRDFVVWVRFADGSQGEIDLAAELWGPVFEPLKDPSFFSRFEVAEYGTIAWPNGADFAPEFLYEQAHVPA